MKAKNPDPLLDEIYDKKEMLASLADGARNVEEIQERIAALFVEDGLGDASVITCSTIHRSKGLEANRVFILADTLKTGDIEEENLRYVAVTRAKLTLVMVSDQVPEERAA
jgi:superfamily I DNA/RNA helicase